MAFAQMGYGRGGWYTPEWVDLFANRWVFGVRAPFPKSADRLLPEYQQVAVGDLICGQPDALARVDTREHAPPSFRFLVLPLGIVDATYGVAMLRTIARRRDDQLATR